MEAAKIVHFFKGRAIKEKKNFFFGFLPMANKLEGGWVAASLILEEELLIFTN